MFETGLVSISFRGSAPKEIAEAARGCGLSEIEWGSDVHVPAGDAETARAVRALTEQNGLRAGSYGSYYRLGGEKDPARAFAPYMESAELLGAKIIRVWGGQRGGAELSDAEFAALASEAASLADLAAARGLGVSLECHPGTVTDRYESALRFLRAAGRENLRTYWQPNQNESYEYNLRSAEALAPYTTNVHVFSWEMTDGALRRYPLRYHEERWRRYLEIFAKAGGRHSLLLEFMHDDRLETLPETAAALQGWAEEFRENEGAL